MLSMDHLSEAIDVDDDAVLDEGNVSMKTPSVFTLRLQNGNVRLGGRFFATVTLKDTRRLRWNQLRAAKLTKWSTGRRVCLIPQRPFECWLPKYLTWKRQRAPEINALKFSSPRLCVVQCGVNQIMVLACMRDSSCHRSRFFAMQFAQQKLNVSGFMRICEWLCWWMLHAGD